MKSSSPSSSVVKTMLGAALLAAASVGAQAQELKIGYVNSDRVLREATLAKAAQAKLEAEFSKRQKEGDDTANRLKAVADKLDKDAPTLSEAERNKRQRSSRSTTSCASCFRRGSKPSCRSEVLRKTLARIRERRCAFPTMPCRRSWRSFQDTAP